MQFSDIGWTRRQVSCNEISKNEGKISLKRSRQFKMKRRARRAVKQKEQNGGKSLSKFQNSHPICPRSTANNIFSAKIIFESVDT